MGHIFIVHTLGNPPHTHIIFFAQRPKIICSIFFRIWKKPEIQNHLNIWITLMIFCMSTHGVPLSPPLTKKKGVNGEKIDVINFINFSRFRKKIKKNSKWKKYILIDVLWHDYSLSNPPPPPPYKKNWPWLI